MKLKYKILLKELKLSQKNLLTLLILIKNKLQIPKT
jgi:hypothetical protein